MRRLLAWASLLAFTGLVASACGSSDDSSFTGDGGPGSGDDGGFIGNGGDGSFGDDGGPIDTDSGLNGCATTTAQAQQLPLDIVIVQDTSGSMWVRTSSGQTKWDAVKTALGGFFSDPASAGIGVGIQFFPLFSTPSTCSAVGQCGGAAPCYVKGCSRLTTSGYQPCESDADCIGGNNSCSVVLNGQCHGEGEIKCPLGATGDSYCNAFNAGLGYTNGPCDPIVSSFCTKEVVDCQVGSAATLAAPIAALPASAAALNGALAAHWPNGQTPTRPALEGGINAAKTYAAANPGHTVVVVLATDGLPTDGVNSGTNPELCPPNHVSDSANVAAAGLASGVKTFVIGVFGPQEATTAGPNLNQIATAGGTGNAFIINTSANATQQFEQALATIRGAALPCQFTLPIPDGGTPDYSKLNVQYTAGNGNVTVIGYATNAAGCSATNGGWYYDKDPASGQTPTQVVMCPATCNVIKGDPKGKIDIVQGCKTVVVVK